MTEREALAATLIRNYSLIQQNKGSAPRCFIGFDGVTDEIIKAVETRQSTSEYSPFQKIADFGQRIVDASGKSCNIELIVVQKKLGGNAPILADALLKGGARITFAGSIGSPGTIEPLFQEMASHCEEVVSMAPSAHSDAIEFEDGKVILGKLDNFQNISYQTLISQIGKEKLKEIVDRSDLFISANWTMLPMMNELWQKMIDEILPGLTKKKRWLYVDLADPAKRVDSDLKQALHLLKKMGEKYTVVQGLNEAEALRMAKILSIKAKGGEAEHVLDLAKQIAEKSGLDEIVIHATSYACAANKDGGWIVEGPYTPKPFITTGAGDNFNAGFCNALLYGLTSKEALLSGVATSGYYVRKGKSPSMEELSAFLRNWK